MNTPISRRTFLCAGAASLLAAPLLAGGGRSGAALAAAGRDMLFRPYPGRLMPELRTAYLADEYEDPFKSSVAVERDGIIIPRDASAERFSVNARWFVEDFGYIWLSADNEGRFYSLADADTSRPFNLNYEFARSRVARNLSVRARYTREGTVFSSEVKHLSALSEELLEDARRRLAGDGERGARYADRALKYALFCGERIELEHARAEIERFHRREIFFGCETRQFVWARSEEFMTRFLELMNFATVTHYVWDSWYELFEPTEGCYNWGIKDDIVHWLADNGVTIEGRPLFWFHPSVTPEWLNRKTPQGLRAYIERHAHDLVSHYAGKIRQWEIVNEYHDYANLFDHSPEEITDIVRLACQAAKEADSGVVRIINNCAPWAEYAAAGRKAGGAATRAQRSPRRFLKDLAEAGVEYDVLGIQIYFPQRDLSDIVRMLERLAALGKPIYITEIGASSDPFGANPSGARSGASSGEPFAWHRAWDEDLQADWLEQVYTIYYSKPWIKAINWYDFSDFRPYIVNGGLVREDSSPKASFRRMKDLLASWEQLPKKKKES